MSKGNRNRTARDAKRIAHDHAQYTEGQWLGRVDANQPFAKELIGRYNAAAGAGLRACPHLQDNDDQPWFWVEAVPELVACKECTAELALEEQRRANTCCALCGAHTALRGVTVATDGKVLRGGVCEKCEERAGFGAS